jgi:hypothetical protein
LYVCLSFYHTGKMGLLNVNLTLPGTSGIR